MAHTTFEEDSVRDESLVFDTSLYQTKQQLFHDPVETTDTDTNEILHTQQQILLRGSSMEKSMDLGNILQEMEETRDNNNNINDSRSPRSRRRYSNVSNASSISIGLSNLLEESQLPNPQQHQQQRVGSNLQLDAFPSLRDLGWGSFNWGSFADSFRQRVFHNSPQLIHRKEVPPKTTTNETAGEAEPPRRERVVRFMKFETVFPSGDSFSR
jgi:hypothetical protein